MSSLQPALRVAQLVERTGAEGPGLRFAIWLQGCPLGCEGCCNPEMFSSDQGELIPVADLLARISKTPDIEGITLLGGEPFAQAEVAAGLCRRVSSLGLSVMVFSGYSLSELRSMAKPARDLLGATDVLVDGRFRLDLPETRRRWIGSSNQEIHFLTSRYQPTDKRFYQPNNIEIRFHDGVLAINGWPALELSEIK